MEGEERLRERCGRERNEERGFERVERWRKEMKFEGEREGGKKKYIEKERWRERDELREMVVGEKGRQRKDEREESRERRRGGRIERWSWRGRERE